MSIPCSFLLRLLPGWGLGDSNYRVIFSGVNSLKPCTSVLINASYFIAAVSGRSVTYLTPQRAREFCCGSYSTSHVDLSTDPACPSILALGLCLGILFSVIFSPPFALFIHRLLRGSLGLKPHTVTLTVPQCPDPRRNSARPPRAPSRSSARTNVARRCTHTPPPCGCSAGGTGRPGGTAPPPNPARRLRPRSDPRAPHAAGRALRQRPPWPLR